MSSGTSNTCDCPEPCRDVLNIVTAEESTLVDAISSDRLDRDDVATFLTHVEAGDHDIDPTLTHLVEIIDELLEKHGV